MASAAWTLISVWALSASGLPVLCLLQQARCSRHHYIEDTEQVLLRSLPRRRDSGRPDSELEKAAWGLPESAVGIKVDRSPDLILARWRKLFWNIAFNGPCALLGGDHGLDRGLRGHAPSWPWIS